MTEKDIKKLSRKELEQRLEQTRELTIRQQRQLIAKNRLIEHLTENARNWTKKFRINDTHPIKRTTDEANTEIAQEVEIQSLQSKLTRLNELNLGLVKRLALMQESHEEERSAINQTGMKTSASAVSQNSAKINEVSSISSPVTTVNTSFGKSSDNNAADKDIEEVSELEFSPEMQKVLAKYVA